MALADFDVCLDWPEPGSRIVVNGADITNACRAIEISAAVGEPAKVRLELFAKVNVKAKAVADPLWLPENWV